MAQEKLSRQEILDFMEQNWAVYLATLDTLPEDQQLGFARAQGYPGAKELVAHITAWWRVGIKRVGELMAGQQPAAGGTSTDEFNARVIQDSRSQTYEQVKEDFENAREEIAGLVAELPDEAFNNEAIYDELHVRIIRHYQRHTPPGDPQIPAARYGGQHPA